MAWIHPLVLNQARLDYDGLYPVLSLAIVVLVFGSWVGLRGSVPIILATFPLVAGLGASVFIFNMVFFIVITSALVQGTTIPLVARRLRIEGPAFRVTIGSNDEPVEAVRAEYLVPERSRVIGRQVAKARLPDGAHLLLIQRDAAFIVPKASTRIRRGDTVVLLADEDAVRELELKQDLQRLGRMPAVCTLAEPGGQRAQNGARDERPAVLDGDGGAPPSA